MTYFHPGRHPFHQIRIARFSDPDDPSIANADVGLHHAPPVEDDRVRDHEIQGPARPRGPWRHAHPVADDLSAAELGFISRHREIPLNLNQQLRIRQPDPIPNRRAIEVIVLATRNLHTKPFPEG